VIKNEEKYEILETIYRSLSTIAFKGVNTETDEKVIIKTSNKELYDAISLSKLKNEFKLLRKLQGEL
jgi:hypothetical protein